MGQNTVVVENEKLRVILSAEDYQRYLGRCRDRVERMRSGEERTHTAKDDAKGRILSDAMRALVHRQVVLKPVELDMEFGRQSVFGEYVAEYLIEQGRYDAYNTLLRANTGRHLSTGQQIELADARAYASGKMGEVNNQKLFELGQMIIKSKNPDDRREWRRLSLMSDSNADPEIAEKIVGAAKAEMEREVNYSKRLQFENLQIEVLHPELMPDQIGSHQFKTMT